MNDEALKQKDPKFDKLYNQIYSEMQKELEDAILPFKNKIKKIFIAFLIIDFFMLFINPPVIILSFILYN